MDVDWSHWGLLAVLAVIVVGWAVLKLAAKVALTLIVLALIAFAALEFGLLPNAA